MKKLMLLAALLFSTGIGSNLCAQAPTVSPPSGSGDKNLRDMDVKSRSVELERVDRDAKKNNASTDNSAKKTAAPAEDKLAAKYEEIKTDYEQIQTLQSAIIKAYQNSGKIDYAQIAKSALEINKGAIRLDLNLFPAVETAETEKSAKKDDQKEKEIKPAKSLRELIVDLDNAIGSFVTSPMFQNLRVVDAAVSAKAKSDLEKITETSALLGETAGKMAGSGN